MEATIAKIKKNSSAEIWVCLREFESRQYVDVREHFLEGDGRVWKPTKKGVMFQPKLLAQVIDGISALGDAAELGSVATIEKSVRDEIQVAYREYEKSRYGEVRIWYWAKGNKKPSSKGVTFRLDLVERLVDALRGAEDQLESD